MPDSVCYVVTDRSVDVITDMPCKQTAKSNMDNVVQILSQRNIGPWHVLILNDQGKLIYYKRSSHTKRITKDELLKRVTVKTAALRGQSPVNLIRSQLMELGFDWFTCRQMAPKLARRLAEVE